MLSQSEKIMKWSEFGTLEKIEVPDDKMKKIKGRKVTYKTLDITSCRAGKTPAQEIEMLAEYKEYIIIFKDKFVSFREVEVIYQDQNVTKEMAIKNIKSEHCVFFLTSMGMSVVSLRLCSIPPEFQMKWVVAATLNKLEKGEKYK